MDAILISSMVSNMSKRVRGADHLRASQKIVLILVTAGIERVSCVMVPP